MPDEESPEEQASISTAEEPPVAVRTATLQAGTFERELVANGKLQAPRRADLRFRSEGLIEKIQVQEGQRVAQGQLLATLDGGQPLANLRQGELDHGKALLDYEDQLLRLGHRLADTATLDENVKAVARLRSGLSQAYLTQQKAHQELAQTKLTAPFAGKIANLKAKPFNSTSSYDYICSLVDDSQLLVEFKVLEQELGFIRESKQVAVSSFGNLQGQRYMGRIESINPQVDEAGMVTIKARLGNPGGRLLDGMGVRVVVQQVLADQLVLPKEAVLDRQGRKVVFTLEDGLAKWHYVEIAYENSSHYALSSGLKAGDSYIYENNFNLAHDKKVVTTK